MAILGFAASLAANAQPTGKVYRIGYLSTDSASSTYTRPLEAFRQGLQELGWVEGRNVHIEYSVLRCRSRCYGVQMTSFSDLPLAST